MQCLVLVSCIAVKYKENGCWNDKYKHPLSKILFTKALLCAYKYLGLHNHHSLLTVSHLSQTPVNKLSKQTTVAFTSESMTYNRFYHLRSFPPRTCKITRNECFKKQSHKCLIIPGQPLLHVKWGSVQCCFSGVWRFWPPTPPLSSLCIVLVIYWLARTLRQTLLFYLEVCSSWFWSLFRI